MGTYQTGCAIVEITVLGWLQACKDEGLRHSISRLETPYQGEVLQSNLLQ